MVIKVKPFTHFKQQTEKVCLMLTLIHKYGNFSFLLSKTLVVLPILIRTSCVCLQIGTNHIFSSLRLNHIKLNRIMLVKYF